MAPTLPVARRPRADRDAVALLLPNLSVGGAERNLVRLAGELQRRGRPVELVVGSADGALARQVPTDVTLVELGARRLRSGLVPLVRYLRRERPAVLLTTVGHTIVLAVVAARLARSDTRVVARIAASVAGRDTATSMRGRASASAYRAAYRRADGLVTNSHDSAAALAEFLRVDRSRVTYLPNLTIGHELADSTAAPVDHPWFQPGTPPVVVAVGRLAPVKNHRLLIDAVAQVRAQRPVRLVIFGEGILRGELEARVRALGLEDAVQLPGLVEDPLPYLRRASVFCLPSNREGMPNALIEALAAGCPVVATDCHSGPRELLQDGVYGRLVPPGDVEEMSAAILAALEEGTAAPAEAWRAHTVEGAGAAYDDHLDAIVASAGRGRTP